LHEDEKDKASIAMFAATSGSPFFIVLKVCCWPVIPVASLKYNPCSERNEGRIANRHHVFMGFYGETKLHPEI